jgi:hypothetical protein
MGRKVGNFTNPDTGQLNWLDMANVPKLPMIPDQITRFKDVRQTLVTYRLKVDEPNKQVQLIAEYEYQGAKITSAEQNMDEELFARQLSECIYADNTVDSTPLVVEAKRLALQDIGEKLLDSGAIMGNAILSGIGFVRSKEIRVITIDSMLVTAYQNGTADIRLSNCVGNAALKNLIEPNIVFYTDSHRLEISGFTIKEDNNDLVRNYIVTVADITVLPKNEEISYEAIELNMDDEETVERFLLSRRSLLIDNSSTEDELDERFADML